ncbi:MAG: C40 family peptidase [Bacteroidaceae bacterium]|nr:C40 family peptidase [Bacteroidaceae bacterium]
MSNNKGTSAGWKFTPVTTSSKSSADSSKSKTSRADMSQASSKLGISITASDNSKLMTESASWVGVRYRAGGADRKGVDCSGLVYAIYTRVYGNHISRCSSADLFSKYCSKISRSSLKQGDLVFFTTDNSGRRIGHSGIFLKGDKFIHASSSKGVIVSSLNDAYWNKHWYAGGRVK